MDTLFAYLVENRLLEHWTDHLLGSKRRNDLFDKVISLANKRYKVTFDNREHKWDSSLPGGYDIVFTSDKGIEVEVLLPPPNMQQNADLISFTVRAASQFVANNGVYHGLGLNNLRHALAWN